MRLASGVRGGSGGLGGLGGLSLGEARRRCRGGDGLGSLASEVEAQVVIGVVTSASPPGAAVVGRCRLTLSNPR